MAQLTAKWRKIGDSQLLQRSSQVVSVIDGRAYVYGGELEPRTPRDNNIQTFVIEEQGQVGGFHVSTPPANGPSPSPRVGTAATTLNGNIYIFSGRGGVAMTPIDESGGVWEYTPTRSEWVLLTPQDSNAVPDARSFHCLSSDDRDTIYLHAGCPEKGRLSDLWAFSVSHRTWTRLSSAPEPGRGGTSIAFMGSALYRMNGFDGKDELGGALDIYEPSTNSWTSHTYPADGQSGPGPRSVSALLPIQIQGRSFLLTLFGENNPSTLGHAGAGKMLGDVWTFDVARKQWHNVEARGDESLTRSADRPVPRGWFAADVVGSCALVQGGLDEQNMRLGDAWLLAFE